MRDVGREPRGKMSVDPPEGLAYALARRRGRTCAIDEELPPAMRIAHLRTVLALALCCDLGLLHGAGASDILTNGGFETGPAIAPSPGTQTVSPGSTALTGWSVNGGAITIYTSSYWAPQAGSRSVALSASGPGAISQSFTSSAGAPYRLTFWLSGEPFTTPIVKHLRVQAGAVTQDYAFDTTPAWHWDMKWAPVTLDFTGTGPTTTVSFTSLDASTAGPALDSALLEALTAGVTPASFELALSPMAPDPLRDSGRIAFSLPHAETVRLSVFDVQGREIAVLAQQSMDPGPHQLAFAPRAAGARAGLYFLVLRAGERSLVRRFTVLP
jgi:choice-of-anchor C domain-containing protein